MPIHTSPSRERGSVVSLAVLEGRIAACDKCRELRRYCDQIAQAKVRRFADWTYWGRPVPGFGDHHANIVIVGLAPAAHGANRTGRVFTGDRSGDFLYAALHRAGLANQPHAVSRDDGLRLKDVYITAALRCAPPGNKPTPPQLANCAPYLIQELNSLRPRAAICLGSIAWKATLDSFRALGATTPRPLPKFGHGVEITIDSTALLGCYHVSQQNTFTGRLTPAMLDAVLRRAKVIARVNERFSGRNRLPTVSKLAR